MKLTSALEARITEEVHQQLRSGELMERLFGERTTSAGFAQELATRGPEEFRAAAFAGADLLVQAVIELYERPSLLVQNDSFSVPVGDVWRDLLEPHRGEIEATLPAVGRIELDGHPTAAWVGTGFLVASDLIATNRHVAEVFVVNDGQGFTWRQGVGGRAIRPRIDFREEHDVAITAEFALTDIVHIEPSGGPDLALLRVETTGLQVQPLTLTTSVGTDDLVATIGYPWRDSRIIPELEEAVERIFGGVFDVKRLAPGKITQVTSTTLFHDCSTLRGNSGSAVVDVETGHVVGVHFGDQISFNVAVPAAVLANRLSVI
jgi:endonuclease G, mitochondrial